MTEQRKHTWRADGSQGKYVHHSSAPGGRGSDTVGGVSDVLGPFPSQKLAIAVAAELNNAYELGIEVAREAERAARIFTWRNRTYRQ